MSLRLLTIVAALVAALALAAGAADLASTDRGKPGAPTQD